MAEKEEDPIQVCPKCTFSNETKSELCTICNHNFSTGIEVKAETAAQICPDCTYLNEHALESCSVCNYKFTIDLNKEREKRITTNYDLACKLIPASMIPSKSPFINCSINGYKFKALVDTGATTSIMSEDMIENCQLADLLDTQYVVQILGVGETKSVGRIYCVDVMIGDSAIPMSFIVLKKPPGATMIIIGMDILTSHGAVIDINKKSIVLSGSSFTLEDK